MARSINDIQTQIHQIVASQSALSALNLSPSQTSIYQEWEYIVASELNYEEQLRDQFVDEINTTIAQHAVGTDQWVYDQSFLFQYDSSTPQIISLVDYVPTYNPVDTTKQIITRCSVKTQPARIVSVKVAKQDPPVALTTSELSAFQSYLDTISFAGVQYSVISANADKLYFKANIYYNGQYAPTIQTVVINAINTFMASLPFDGVVRVNALIDAIQATTGVTDVKIENMGIRADSSSTYIYLVQNFTENLISLPLVSGYIVEETNSGFDFASTLTFIPQ